MKLILLDAFSVAQYITHPISLLAYISAAVMAYFISRDINRRKLIESAPEAERADVIIKTAERLHLDLAIVPENQRAGLIRQVLKNRIYTQLIIAVIVLAIGTFASYIALNFINHAKVVPATHEQKKMEISDVTARVTYTIGEVGKDVPEIFQNNSQLELRIAENIKIVNKDVVGWQNGFFLPDSLFKLTSTKQEFDRKFNPTGEGTSLDLIRDYSRFTGHISYFDEDYDWNKASFEGMINVSEPNTWVDSLINENSDFHISQEDFFQEYRVTPRQKEDWTEYDKRLYVYPIRATLDLFYKGKIIGRSNGIVVRVIEHQEGDYRRLFVVKFPVTKLSNSKGI